MPAKIHGSALRDDESPGEGSATIPGRRTGSGKAGSHVGKRALLVSRTWRDGIDWLLVACDRGASCRLADALSKLNFVAEFARIPNSPVGTRKGSATALHVIPSLALRAHFLLPAHAHESLRNADENAESLPRD